MKKLHFLLFALAGLSISSNAKVWEATNQWDMKWESRYERWMESDAVHKDMFISKKSKYYGGRFDCADAAYALRAIFASENSLPFAVRNPTGDRGRVTYFTNDTDRFDKYTEGPKRVIAFLNYLGDMIGSENLTRFDTYPVAISSIKSSHLFTYKIKARFGKWIRHVYTIKEVNPTGTFDLIYSTQAIRKKKLPMNYRPEKPLVNKPHDTWGFRGFIWPSLVTTPKDQFPRELAYSTEQYQWARKSAPSAFFKKVKDTIKEVEESDEAVLERAYKNVCSEAQARIKYVQQGVDRMNELNGKCMNYADYDAYSTPARDKALKDTYENLWNHFKSFVNENSVDPNSEVFRLTNTIFWNNKELLSSLVGPDQMDKENLMKSCPIEYREGKVIDLSEVFLRMRKNLLSSHPNDSLKIRWGEKKGPKTQCKAWY